MKLSQYKLHRFTIPVENWQIQKTLTKILGILLFLLVGLATFQAIDNNQLRKNILTEKVFLFKNNNHIKSIKDAKESVTQGDQILLKEYLSTFILAVEKNQLPMMKAFANPILFSKVKKKKQKIVLNIQVKIIKSFAIDKNLQQIDYFVQIGEMKQKKNAVVKWQLLPELQEYDTRLRIQDFDMINPLLLEVSEFHSTTKLE